MEKPEQVDVLINGPVMVEIDGTRLAQIIFEVCHTSEARAAEAANKIVDYLIGLHQNATPVQ